MSTSSLPGALKPLLLPPAPESQTGPVKAWSEAVTIPSYPPALANRNPVFTNEKSAVQGYPLPVLEVTDRTLAPRPWQAIHLENEFLRLLIIPELRGRVHLALDKSDGREFLYRDEAINAGASEIPGGLQVQFPALQPQQPVSSVFTQIEEHADGARTVWCSAFDPVTRLKGMHGICLYPGRAYIELKARLTNGTPFSQSFHWNAVAAVPAANHSLVGFPELASDAGEGFAGAYCREGAAGLLLVADQHSSGGKGLQVHSGYGELRVGMYSGLPPRVSVLAPSETKSFSQYWVPYTRIGSIQKANVDVAACLYYADRTAVGINVTRAFPSAAVVLESEGTVLQRWTRNLLPGQPLAEETSLPPEIDSASVTLKVLNSAGRELLVLTPAAKQTESVPSKRQESEAVLAPRRVAAVESLYLRGLRARHDRGFPHRAEEYWLEAVRREPSHAASNNALGLLQLQRGEFGEAETRFRTALSSSAASYTDSQDGEYFYNLGLALRFQERDEEAYAAFQRAGWTYGWRAPALQAAAEIECKRSNFGVVPKYLYESLRLNADNNHARNLATVLFRRFGRSTEAEQLVRESLTVDPLDPWACHLAGGRFPGDNQTRLDLAFTYARSGLYELAVELLTAADTFASDGSLPMVHYTLAAFYLRLGDIRAAQREYGLASATQSDFCFPHRLDEMMVLARAVALQPEDARAQYYLGCLLYFFGLPLQALEIWQSSAELDSSFAPVWRNLALGHYNVTGDNEKALAAFDQAVAANPSDARIVFERDQLWQRLGVPPTIRLGEMQGQDPSAIGREDLVLELVRLHNTNGDPESARALFSSGKMSGWENDPKAVDQYLRTFIKLGRQALARGDAEGARTFFMQPLSVPVVSTEHPAGLPKSAELHFWIGESLNAEGHTAAAQAYWQKAINVEQSAARTSTFNEATFFIALSLGRIGDRQQSRKLLRELWFAGRRLARDKSTGSSSADGFKDDTSRQQRIRGLLWQAQARVGLAQYRLASRLLQQLLSLDPNHDRALDLISDLETAIKAS